MKVVTINHILIDMFAKDPEFLRKSKRPCVLIVRLKYKGHNHKFAIPLRSNIPAASPKDEYFALPPRTTTRPKNRHGIHYIKMFPVKNEYLQIYRMDGDMFSLMTKAIIDKNEKRIIQG